jgi:hypothetical protein
MRMRSGGIYVRHEGPAPHSLEAVRDYIANDARRIVGDRLHADTADVATATAIDALLVQVLGHLNTKLGQGWN